MKSHGAAWRVQVQLFHMKGQVRLAWSSWANSSRLKETVSSILLAFSPPVCPRSPLPWRERLSWASEDVPSFAIPSLAAERHWIRCSFCFCPLFPFISRKQPESTPIGFFFSFFPFSILRVTLKKRDMAAVCSWARRGRLNEVDSCTGYV